VINSYFDTNEKKDCNGCGVCSLKCPKKAIKMVEDEEGFLYPHIDKNKCVECGLCKRVCPNHIYNQNNLVKTYIAINNHEEVKKSSASGGLFIALTKYIIEKKGVVFGVKYDDELKVCHGFTTSTEKVKEFQNSKYVRSDLKDSYQKVENFLKEDKYVLFTGTPCQCQGLRTFLGKDYDKLITCDIICHANPSPKIFEMFKSNIEKKYKTRIKKITFRPKQVYGWHSGSHTLITLNYEKIIDCSEYCDAFLNELINRPSCHNCCFCTSNRLSDFTIGDMWGIDKIDSVIKDDNSGISLLCVNSNKAVNIIEEIKEDLFLKEIDKDKAFMYNHNKNVLPHKNRDKFFKGVSSGIINDNNVIYYLRKYTKRTISSRIINKIKKIIKRIINK